MKEKTSKQYYKNILFHDVTILTIEIDRIIFYIRLRKANQASSSTLHVK